MQEKRRKYSPEFKAEAARLVIETSRPIVEVARELGIHEGTLGAWVNKYRAVHAGDEPSLNLSERARLKELEREVRELRMKTEFRYAFIDAEKARYPIVKMCVWLDVSTSGYYEWGDRPPSALPSAGRAWPRSSERFSTSPMVRTGTVESTPRWPARAQCR